MSSRLIDPLDSPLFVLLAPWINRANDRIASTTEDARAHAERSLTNAAKNAQDGRPTWRKLSRQRSHLAAKRRLDDLLDWLAGTTKASLSGFVQDARRRFYRDAFTQWHELPVDIRDGSLAPTVGGGNQAAGIIIHGLSPRQELEPIFIRAINALTSVLNAASSRDAVDADTLLDTWENRTRDSIQQQTVTLLSDSQVAIRTLVGQHLIRPEFRSRAIHAKPVEVDAASDR